VANIVYLVAPYALGHDTEFAYKTFLAQTILSVALGRTIVNSVRDGFVYEYYFDLYVLNLVVQFFTPFSDYAWLLYLIVPGLLLYKGGRMLLSWVFTPTADELMEDNPDPKLLKKQKKAERKRQRQMNYGKMY